MGVYIGLGLPRRQTKGSTFGQFLRYPDSYTGKKIGNRNWLREVPSIGFSKIS